MAINISYQRTIDMTPFKLVFGVEMNHPEFQSIKKAVELEHVKWHGDQHEENRQLAKKQILKAQTQQQQSFNKSRKVSYAYYIGELVTIKRKQYSPASKLCKKFL